VKELLERNARNTPRTNEVSGYRRRRFFKVLKELTIENQTLTRPEHSKVDCEMPEPFKLEDSTIMQVTKKKLSSWPDRSKKKKLSGLKRLRYWGLGSATGRFYSENAYWKWFSQVVPWFLWIQGRHV
jgi:hypothetical protein